jgi:hypothetical protein
MLDGLYKVKFRTGGDEGTCVCLFKNGRIAGGGAVMYYTGEYHVTGNTFTGDLVATRHANKKQAAPIMGLDSFHMKIEGIQSGGYAQIIAKVPEVPDLILMASLTRLSEV